MSSPGARLAGWDAGAGSVYDTAVTSPLLRILLRALDAVGGPGAGEHLVVAVSGGPDSTALLAALSDLAPARSLQLTAAHVDHGLRGHESAAEGRGVAALAAQLGVGFVSRAAVVEPGAGVEARARQLRYRALAAMARAAGATWIVTAHTLDDQAETLLLRLLRGAGRGGLGGMSPVRGQLFRPLLGATRADVRRFLAERGLPFAVDRSNADLRFARNRIRRLVLPLLEAEFNPRLRIALASLATRLGDEEAFLKAAAASRSPQYLVGDDLRTTVVTEPAALARRIVRQWLEEPSARTIGAGHVERVLDLAAGRMQGAVAVPGPARVVRERDLLVRREGRAPATCPFSLPIVPGTAVCHPGGAWQLSLSAARARRAGEERPEDSHRVLFDADALPTPLTVRAPVPGDRVRVLGGHTRKLQDILVDARVPRERRAAIPVLVVGTEVLWVGGLVRGARAPVQPGTERIVEAVLDCRS